MSIYYIGTLAFIVLLLTLFIFTYFKMTKYRNSLLVKTKELDVSSSKISLLSKQIIIKSVTLETCIENNKLLKKENSDLKSKAINNKHKVETIANFINEIKKT